MVTFGFTLLVTDVAIMIMTYYSVIGGWITEYLAVYLAGQGVYAAEEGYFTSFITSCVQRSWTTLAGVSPVTVIASEPCS